MKFCWYLRESMSWLSDFLNPERLPLDHPLSVSLTMASAHLLQRSSLTSPCLCAPHRRPVLLQSSALSSARPFQSLGFHIRFGQNVASNDQPLQGRLRATPDDDTVTKRILDFASSNFLPLVLLTGVTVGLICPRPGQIAQQWGLSRWSTFGIFFVSGLSLKTGDMLQAASAWPAALFGVVSILFITPLASIPIMRLPLTPKELATGLAIFCCVPTTLSSGVSLTQLTEKKVAKIHGQLAGANTALALSLTITSNLVGIFTMPFMLSSFVGRSVGISLPTGPLLKALLETLLVPLVIGKLFRELSGYASFFDGNKRYTSMISSSLLALVPWMQASCSRDMLLKIDPVQLLAAITCGIGLHTVYLVWNTLAMRFLPAFWDNKDGNQVAAARAVILVASQKTLPVLVAVVASLNGVLGEAGLLVLPCIATHLSQIIYDSILVSHWLAADKSSANLKTA